MAAQPGVVYAGISSPGADCVSDFQPGSPCEHGSCSLKVQSVRYVHVEFLAVIVRKAHKEFKEIVEMFPILRDVNGGLKDAVHDAVELEAECTRCGRSACFTAELQGSGASIRFVSQQRCMCVRGGECSRQQVRGWRC